MVKPVIIGVGFNIHPDKLSTNEYLDIIIRKLEQAPLKIVNKARIYNTVALGAPGQPDYINTVFQAETYLSPKSLLRVLKSAEQSFGRRGKSIPWSARVLDLDLIEFKGIIRGVRDRKNTTKYAAEGSLYLPHRHAHARSFVLAPLMDIVPHWRHPILGQSVKFLLETAKRREKNGPGSIINAEN